MQNATFNIKLPTVRRRSGMGIGFVVLLALGAVFIALLGGAAAGIGSVLGTVLLAGTMAGVFLLSKPVWMFWLMLSIVLVLNGTAQFFVGFHQLQWIASGLGVALLFTAMLKQVTNKVGQKFTPLSALAITFLALLTATSAINYSGPGEALVGLRTYLPFWGVFFFIHSGAVSENSIKRVMYGLVAIAAIQWPVELYQKIFVASVREEKGYFGSAWDSIVGTFGGAMFGGGASGSLAVYVTAIGLIAVAWWRRGFLTTRVFSFIALSCLLALGLSETKAVFVLLPVGLFVLYRRDLLARPGQFLIGSLAMISVLSLLLYGYYKLFWEQQHTRGSIWRVLEVRFMYSFDPNFMASRDWPGRLTGLFIWWRKHDVVADPLHTVIGHGAGSATSFSSLLGQGSAVKRFGQGLDVTGATKLLWETGFLGTLIFVLILVVGYKHAGALSREASLPGWHRANLEGIQACMPVLGLAILYEVTMVSSPPMQFAALALLGIVSYWYRQVRIRA